MESNPGQITMKGIKLTWAVCPVPFHRWGAT
jgi:hypothetical protein